MNVQVIMVNRCHQFYYYFEWYEKLFFFQIEYNICIRNSTHVYGN